MSGAGEQPPDPAMIKAQYKARMAVLIDHFHVLPSQLARMTPRQKEELYFHARDKEGRIEMPGVEAEARFKTCEEELADKANFNGNLKRMGLEVNDEQGIYDGIKKKWAAKTPKTPKKPEKTFKRQT